MKDEILKVCTYCHKVPSSQSINNCPRCKRKLTLWDRSKEPIERKPEWTLEKNKTIQTVEQDKKRIDYTKYFKTKHDN